jgi:hypothetical protein
MNAVQSATSLLDGLPDKPTGDDPPPFKFGYVVEQLELLKSTVKGFEDKLSARPEIS